jgi:hypothetical protein
MIDGDADADDGRDESTTRVALYGCLRPLEGRDLILD